MKKHLVRTFFFMISVFYLSNPVVGQGRIILNGAKVNIRNGAALVVANGASNALTRNSGHIISEGETNLVKWNIQNNTGTYVLPWGVGNTDYIPFSFTKTAGTGTGYYTFSTYPTGWQNSMQLPAGITNLNHNNQDNSALVLDRFWQLNAQDYTQNPNLSNLVFSYLETEYNTANNIISEDGLLAQRWNNQTNTWEDLSPGGSVNTSENTLTVSSISGNNAFTWWALVAENSTLPLYFLSFDIQKKENQVKLLWQTTQEVNVSKFEIQRSSDLTNFKTVGTLPAKGSLMKNEYNFTDNNLLPGIYYYRLKSIDLDNSFLYSGIKAINYNVNNEIVVFPNPIKNNTVQISYSNPAATPLEVYLYDLQGKLIQQEQLEFKSQLLTWNIKTSLIPGIYLFKLKQNSFIFQQKIQVE